MTKITYYNALFIAGSTLFGTKWEFTKVRVYPINGGCTTQGKVCHRIASLDNST